MFGRSSFNQAAALGRSMCRHENNLAAPDWCCVSCFRVLLTVTPSVWCVETTMTHVDGRRNAFFGFLMEMVLDVAFCHRSGRPPSGSRSLAGHPPVKGCLPQGEQGVNSLPG